MATSGVVQKPRMSFWQIFNMSFGFLGIQFGFALQTGNASRILQTFGADVENLSLFWLAAPITGMIIQPIIGHYSDRTWTRLGRRRPYFLTGALLSGVALLFMPNSSMLAAIIPPIVVGAGMLMIMDASFNVAMEPFRALVADNLPDSQHNDGFSMQTCLIGVGAVIGSWLPYVFANWLGVSDTAPQGHVPNNLLFSFYIGALTLIGSILWTVIKTKEYPPEEYAKFHEPEIEEEEKKSGLVQIFSDLFSMPKTMWQLGIVQFFSWFALFSMWVYTTPAIAEHVYHIKAGDTSSHAYNTAGNWVGVLFGVYNIVSAAYALLLPRIVRKSSRKKTHAFSLTMGGLGLISIFFIQNDYVLILPMIGIGLAWGSILAMPYAILSSAIPAKKIGVYMGIFNLFITMPQIVSGVSGKFLMKYIFSDHAVYGLIMAGGFMVLGAVSVLFVQDGKKIQIIDTPLIEAP
ncbi:MFS transporter [uncultured Mucilaginibacter sp.]|uniref:MFS transporter n=1 Tax=uncultured Mucilaginibacter sp. TaxID=797541 RepID=UPI0025F7883E|nr:MFS transporter [uncultured Mucilaginibacter sp.]